MLVISATVGIFKKLKFTVYLWIYCVNPWIKHTTVIIYLDKEKYLC